jgi:hypothetical protein
MTLFSYVNPILAHNRHAVFHQNTLSIELTLHMHFKHPLVSYVNPVLAQGRHAVFHHYT